MVNLVLMFIICGLPFFLVENPVVMAFFAVSGLRWTLPGRSVLNNVLVELYVHCRDLLRAIIAAAAASYKLYPDDNTPQRFFHMTTDTWGSKYQKRDYSTIVGAWMGSDWSLNIRTVTTASCCGTKTAPNMTRWLDRKMRTAVNVRLDQCASITSDGGSELK
jgi:hypothetical protein